MKRDRASRPLLVAASIAALGVCFAPLPPARGSPAGSSLAMRLFGPIAALAASAQWVRADVAFRNGRVELFLTRARTALALDPQSAEGWNYLASHQAYALASKEREPDPERRLAWIRAGLATAAEGERVSSQPEELALSAGVIMLSCALDESTVPWPGGLAAIWEAAALHFERAARLGYDAETCSALSKSARKAAQTARDGR